MSDRTVDSDAFDASLLDCEDCGISAWSQIEDGQLVHEDFYVHDELWDLVCPDDEVRTIYRDGERYIARADS